MQSISQKSVPSIQIQNEDEQCQYMLVCDQFYLIGPQDISSYSSIKVALTKIINQNFPKDLIIDFIKGNLTKFGFPNARQLHRIKTQYFWGGTIGYMIQCILKDNHRLSACISTLTSTRSTIVQISKYDVFLILTNMFLGILPPQIYNKNTNFGKLMSVMQDQDETFSRKKLDLRLNKLKTLVNYFCVTYKQHSDSINKQQMEMQNHQLNSKIVFHRAKCPFKQEQILDDTIMLAPVQIKKGKYYQNDNQINSLSIVSSVSQFPGQFTDSDRLEFQQKIFFSHPEFFVIKLLQCGNLSSRQCLIVHGAEKYCSLNALSKQQAFNFSQRYKDHSENNPITGLKKTSFIWIKRQNYPSHCFYDIYPEVEKLVAGINGCKHFFNNQQDKLISGNYKNIYKKSLKAPSDIKFMSEWIAASVCGWHKITYYVDDEKKMKDFAIMASQLNLHTIRDILGIIQSFYDFRLKGKASISLLEYVKRFVL